MVTILFHDTIFGPIHSRRLGTSLGVNLMPNDGKSARLTACTARLATMPRARERLV